MRKFTKDIASLLTSFALTSSLGGVSAYTDEPVQLSGQAQNPDCYAETTDTHLIGTQLPTTTTVCMTTPPMMGTEYPETVTTAATTIPPLEGTYAPTPMTTAATTIPSMIGTQAPHDIGTEPTPPLAGAMMTLPPMSGDIAPADGDANGDGIFDESDIAALNQFLLNAPEKTEEETEQENTQLNNWYGADLNYDNKLNAEDLTMMLRERRSQK